MRGLGIAFKEWAVICRALAEGRQALILRKGGVAEAGGEFRAAHGRFWLYPTWVHQQQGGVSEAAPPLAEVIADRPPEGVVRLTHFAEAPRVYHFDDLEKLLKLAPLHCWTRETVEARFRYRSPGLFVLPVRVWRAAAAHDLPETAEYAGCKSWVDLGRDLDTAGATPVLDDDAFAAVLRQVGPLAVS